MNQENIILSADDVADIELFVSGITGATISYSTRSSVEGGSLTDAQTYTIAGVMENYASLSNLEMADGYFLSDDDNESKTRVCVLGASVAKELFGSAADAYESTIYIDDRAYTICGVLETSSTVSAGISPDEAIFIPYETGIKYITGESISPTITVIAEDVNTLDSVISSLEIILAENYNNAEFTFSDAGSKMEAAESSNQILTLLLAAMAVIVFIVGGIGIMNVLFVSVKERTGQIGILKSLGASRSTILLEFLLESAAISLLGGILGVGASFLVTPIVEHYSIRVEANVSAWGAALGFAVLTGTLFGFYPAWKASKLQNIVMPLLMRGMSLDEAEDASMSTIEMLGLKDRIHHKPRELSGGQQQRVAIARALVGEPAILLADEPTGALDQASGQEVLNLFARLNEMGNTIVMITHDLNVAQRAKRIVKIVDGELHEM